MLNLNSLITYSAVHYHENYLHANVCLLFMHAGTMQVTGPCSEDHQQTRLLIVDKTPA